VQFVNKFLNCQQHDPRTLDIKRTTLYHLTLVLHSHGTLGPSL